MRPYATTTLLLHYYYYTREELAWLESEFLSSGGEKSQNSSEALSYYCMRP